MFQGPPELYSDSMTIAANPFGFRFDFGLATDSPGSQRTVAVVRMSPQHALAFSMILGQHLESYQAEMGTINLPENVRRRLQAGPEEEQ